jgi:hypothetical protein
MNVHLIPLAPILPWVFPVDINAIQIVLNVCTEDIVSEDLAGIGIRDGG